MDCEKLRMLLDAYIDGELSEAEMRDMKAHAQTCEACRCELQTAMLVRDALKEVVEEEITPPLPAQAAWRNAVRAQAKKQSMQRKLRVVYGVAAALVVFLGSTFIINSQRPEPVLTVAQEDHAPEAMLMAPMATQMAPQATLIARDGEVESASFASGGQNDYDVWKKLEVEDAESAARTIEDLALEYSGNCDTQEGGVCCIELPAYNLEDFLTASMHLGVELDAESQFSSAETVVVYIQIVER